MDINIPLDFVPAMASSTTSNMGGVGIYVALILGLLFAFYLADTLVDVLTYKDDTHNENTTAL